MRRSRVSVVLAPSILESSFVQRCSFSFPVCQFAAFKREPRQVQTTDFGEHAIEGWLILEGAEGSGCAIDFMHDLESLQPLSFRLLRVPPTFTIRSEVGPGESAGGPAQLSAGDQSPP